MDIRWQLEELDTCSSTFDVARHLPPWTVVACRHQSAGRGRFNRRWFGEEGGLWASYTVPLNPGSDRNWGLLPLVAGAALMQALRPFAIPGLRLRWPNDLLVGRAKLAGILVERPKAAMASLGIGLNMFNNVAALSGRTMDPPARLADLVRPCPAVAEMRDRLAAGIAATFLRFAEGGLAALAAELDAAWGEPHPVVAITDTARYCGFFAGMEPDGSPRLRLADGTVRIVPAIEVMRLKELL